MSRKTLVLWGCLLAVLGLTAQPVLAGKKAEDLRRADSEIPDARLLDMGVHVFSPGFPETLGAIEAAREEGVFTELRRSEAQYLPFLLVKTLQSSGFWGTVRVVPESHIVDVAVSATVLKSTGKKLKLKVVVQDARGKVWLKKKYKQRADYSKFYRDETRCDPFQSLYHRIANDIAKVYAKLDEDDIALIRTISRLQFAVELVPEVFGDYLSVNNKARYRIERLPAIDDPMMARVDSVRARDRMFVDLIQGYYAGFHAQMREPYDEYRERSFSRQLIAEGLARRGYVEMLLGVGTIAAGAATIAAGAATAVAVGAADDGGDGGEAASGLIMEAATSAGASLIEGGVGQLGESRSHRRALRELGESIDTGVTPVLVRFEGEICRLTGSMEAQYENWREILRQILATETGLSFEADVSIASGAIISRRMATTLAEVPAPQPQRH